MHCAAGGPSVEARTAQAERTGRSGADCGRGADTAGGALAAVTALVETDADLDAFLRGCADVVGIDTEFLRERTFFPIAALYQLAGDPGVALVDACSEHDFDALKTLLVDAATTKVMHSCSEDLEVMDCHLGIRPVNLMDTQVAHAFVSPDFGRSYAALVEHYLGVVLDKHETRSNWLRRPLSAAQLEYAREDVTYLGAMWSRMRERLVEAGRFAWFREEMTGIVQRPEANPEDYYLGMKRAWRLAPRELAALRRMAAWREREARRRDVPRARTVRDEHLVAIAEAPAPSRGTIFGLMPPGVARRYADDLLDAYARGREEPAPAAPPRPLSTREGGVLKAMRDFARERADALGMAPELLSRKRLLEACVRHFRDRGELPGSLGWRLELVGERFGDLLRSSGP